MTTSGFGRVREIFVAALKLPEDQRESFVAESCADDGDLLSEVQSLLEHYDNSSDAVGTSPFRDVADRLWDAAREESASNVLLPTVRGYQVLGRIAVGGMGEVYEALQDSPRRRVAIKTVRYGSFSPALLRRFEDETELLGQLQHPGICQIFEAGTLDFGDGERPFFAMEFVSGPSLDQYVDGRELSTRSRLALFLRICDAVTYAHQKGIVHRDLKPENILVEQVSEAESGTDEPGLGRPKVLDFGVARMSDSDLQATRHTSDGQLVGTLRYMSPEQVAGDPRQIDARSDIFALGVILYELLAGRPPQDLREVPVIEAARRIREDDPTALSSVDAALAGDLATIVHKSIEKEKDQRYASVADLAGDIRRYLSHEPITARPTTFFYQLRKLTRRHRTLFAATAVTLLALTLGAIVSILFAIQSNRNAERAESAAIDARKSSYRASMAAATSALVLEQDGQTAKRHLLDAPAEYRNWEWGHLRARIEDAIVATHADAPDQPSNFQRCAFHQNGSAFWARISGKEFEIVDLDTGVVQNRVTIRSAPRVWALSADASRLAAVTSTGNELLILDASTGKQLPHTPLEGFSVQHISFSPDSQWILVLDMHRLTVLNAATGQMRFRVDLPGAAQTPRSAYFSRDGSRIVFKVIHDLYVLDGASGATISWRHSSHWGHTIAISADGRTVAVATADESSSRAVEILDAETLQLVSKLTGQRRRIATLVASTDGNYWVGICGAGILRYWEASPPHSILHARAIGESPSQSPLDPQPAIAVSPDSTRVSLSDTGRVRLLERTESSTTLRGHETYVYFATYSPDGSMIASRDYYGSPTIRLWDAVTGKALAVLDVEANPPPLALGFSPDGSRIWSDAHGKLWSWDVTTGEKHTASRSLDDFSHVSNGGSRRLGPQWAGQCLTSSPDRSLIISGVGDAARVLVHETGQELCGLRGHEQPVSATAISHDNRIAATGSRDEMVRIWELPSGRALRVLEGHTSVVYSVAFSPDGSRLVSGGNDNDVIVWDVESGERVAVLQGHASYVHAVAFSPDGTQVLSGSGDLTVRIWDSLTRAERRQQARFAASAREQVRPRVVQWLQRFDDAAAVAEHIRATGELDATQRRAALRVLLEQSAAARRVGQAPR